MSPSNQDYVNDLRMDYTTFIELLEQVTPYIKKGNEEYTKFLLFVFIINMRCDISANEFYFEW